MSDKEIINFAITAEMKTIDYIKANRKGSREAELSFENGWKCHHKIHLSKKNYSRKLKHRHQSATKA